MKLRKTGSSKSVNGVYSSKINTFVAYFQHRNQNIFYQFWLTTKPNKDYIYHYKDGSGWKYKGTPYNTAGWTSVEIAGKIIEKIGPILAINKLIFTTTMLLKI